MNTIIKKILPVLVIIILLCSCEDWLELKPEDNVVKQDFWKSEQQVHSFALGLYGKLLVSDLAEKLFLWGEIRGDGLQYNHNITEDLIRIMFGIITEDNENFKWASFYDAINQCNIMIEHAHEAAEADITFTQEKLKAYESEAYAIRALLYFYLVRSFGDVPLMLDAVTNDQVDFFIPKSTQQEVLVQIINDLDTARKYAIEDYENVLYNKGRITKYGVDAILADVHLWNDDYESCIEVCNEIINSAKYGLVSSENWLQEIFIDGNSNESIFELQFSVNKTNPFYNFFQESNGYFFISTTLPEIFEANDIRGDSTTYYGNSGIIYKYMVLDPEEDLRRSESNYEANWIFYRYADILLMKAEALNELERGAEAIALVNKIQSRANATTIIPDDTDYDEIRLLILHERRKEFAYEGKRWFDVLRNAKRENYENEEILFEMIESYAPADLVDLIKSLYSNPLSHYFPIYYEELEVNKSLEQNPYYIR